jgi:thioredoxin-like negative regulator of GroEL
MQRPNKRYGWPFLAFVVLMVGVYAALGRRAVMPEAFERAQSLDQAEARARDTGLPVLVFADAEWCVNCATMKRGALRNTDVARWIRDNTIPVVLDMSNRDAPPPLADSLGVRSLPTLLIMRDGKVVQKLEGVAKAEEVLAWLSEHTGPLADWRYANPGRDLPAFPAGTKPLQRPPSETPLQPR